MVPRPPSRGETSITIWGVGSRHVSTSPPEHRTMGRIWPCPPPRATTGRRTRCQPHGRGKGQAPQLTRTDPSRKTYPRQSHAPARPGRNHKGQAEPTAEPKRNHTASSRRAEPAAAAEDAERVRTEQPTGTSDGFATNGGPPRTHRRTGRA